MAPDGDLACARRNPPSDEIRHLAVARHARWPATGSRARPIRTGKAKSRLAGAAPRERQPHTEGKSDRERINYAFRRTLSRPPSAEERKELLDLLDKERRRIAEGWVNPLELATGKDEAPARLPAGATPTQLAAYTVVSRVLLNLDETITKE